MNYQEVVAAYCAMGLSWAPEQERIIDQAWGEVKAKYPRIFPWSL